MRFSAKSFLLICIRVCWYALIGLFSCQLSAQSFTNLSSQNSNKVFAGIEDNNHLISGYRSTNNFTINVRHTLQIEKLTSQFAQVDLGYRLPLDKKISVYPRVYALTNYNFKRKFLLANTDIQYTISKVELAYNVFVGKSNFFDGVKYYQQFGINYMAGKDCKLVAWYGPSVNFASFANSVNIGTLLHSNKLFGRVLLNVPQKQGVKYSSINTSICYSIL